VVVFSYDGEGNRVKKQVPANNAITFFVYDLNGNLVAEYSNTAAAGSGTKFITADALGSTRVVTDANQNVLARFDYLPFGEDMPTSIGNRSSVQGYNNTDDTRQKFTGHERDPETGLDHSFARDLATALGRFTSTDPYLGGMSPVDPQSMNLQSYVLNNPLNYLDPWGLDCRLRDEGWVCTPEGAIGAVPPLNGCVEINVNGIYSGSTCGDLYRILAGGKLPPMSQMQAANTPQPTQCKPGRQCSDAYKRCVNEQLVKAMWAGSVETVTGVPDEINKIQEYIAANKGGLGAVVSSTLAGYGLGAGAATTVGAFVSEYAIPVASLAYAGYRIYQGAKAANAHMEANASQCDKL
jgi:RHS repeat-associated protein